MTFDMRNPPDDWVVHHGNFVYTVKQLKDMYAAQIIDEFTFHRAKRVAKPPKGMQ